MSNAGSGIWSGSVIHFPDRLKHYGEDSSYTYIEYFRAEEHAQEFVRAKLVEIMLEAGVEGWDEYQKMDFDEICELAETFVGNQSYVARVFVWNVEEINVQ